ncbi:LADA_0H06106g1_1 [Lachancea dasiensis]|uniref:LADA_0H06106g1_1 n=1 Tax=Lachancea dasiensis TaxID=1072105 RepID=A0A1G4K1G7_9SACH|nr:LADA_0H06106g1_1 [Lachancea dasiensis]
MIRFQAFSRRRLYLNAWLPQQRVHSSTKLEAPRVFSRWLNVNNVHDPKHVFTNPSNNEVPDSMHFFSRPDSKMVSEEELVVGSIQQSIKNQRRKRLRDICGAFAVALVGTILGYSIGYRVVYLHEESFIPVYPVPKARNFSDDELRSINTQEIREMAEYKLLEKLSMHPMIKEEYGVPLHKSPGVSLKTHEFSVWQEDPNPCLAGFQVVPRSSPNDGIGWHLVPFLFKWRLSTRSIDLTDFADRILGLFGVESSDIYQIVNPSLEPGGYKYERPPHYSQNHRATNLCFMGELDLGQNDRIVFKGRYHVDIKLQQVDLLRKEKGKLVRYVLYQSNAR